MLITRYSNYWGAQELRTGINSIIWSSHELQGVPAKVGRFLFVLVTVPAKLGRFCAPVLLGRFSMNTPHLTQCAVYFAAPVPIFSFVAAQYFFRRPLLLPNVYRAY